MSFTVWDVGTSTWDNSGTIWDFIPDPGGNFQRLYRISKDLRFTPVSIDLRQNEVQKELRFFDVPAEISNAILQGEN